MVRHRPRDEAARAAEEREERPARPAPGDPDVDLVERLEQAVGDIADRLRGSGVGTEDPNIVGDVGTTDVAPGRDPGERGPTAEGEASGAERESGPHG